jgi:decaprenylphospho-beta-D-erythro-pentofuranosid-2-ulose 2-reductase
VIDALGGVQRVLVLGGSSELAAATLAAMSLRPGAKVLLAGRAVNPTFVASLGMDLGPEVTVSTVEWDAAGGAEAAVAVVDAAVAELGDLDVVIAAAGVLGLGAAASVTAAAEVLSVNVVGVGAACLAAAAALRAQGRGVLIVFSSVAGLRARADNFVYGASKAGLDALASGLADSLAGTGVRVIVVRPGFVVGRMTEGMPPAPFATTPAAVGAAVAGALHSHAEVVHIPRQLGPVFRVMQQLPRPIWRKLSARP